MKTFFVKAASTEWCGISVDLIVNAPDNFDEDSIRENEKLVVYIDEAMYTEVSSWDDDGEESECTWDFETIEETTDPEMINCAAYETITLE